MLQDSHDIKLISPILERIREELENKKVSQYSLAKRTGLPKSTVSYVFREGWGKQLAIIQKMCNELGLELTVTNKNG